MPRRRRTRPRPNSRRTYSQLGRRLSLLSWLHSLLGYADTKQLLDDTRPAKEGFDGDGRSDVYRRLASRDNVKISAVDLRRYDDNVRDHLAAMNEGRTRPITLRYFQYLAALYTEIFLDRHRQSPAALLDSMNKHVAKLNSNRKGSERVEQHDTNDLKKLAFWMATGSGKTLLLHLNYRQYLHYNREPLDNILLITPNEGLSQQHLAELGVSGIPARRFDLHESGLYKTEADAVRVIEITKLVSKKRGQGVSVPVEAFEGRNLIFVDEGHKGSGGEAWREVRDSLGRTGFTFEYSATFGQALTAARNNALTMEYGKSIAFDYSYRYFYEDGFGKDFHILNLRQETTEERRDTLLLANLLSFYEQQLVFANHAATLRPYNLERPLWVFVGSSVNAVRTERGQARSDVLTVARFLHRTLSDASWATDNIGQLMEGDSGLIDEYGVDVYKDKYPYLRNGGQASPSAVYQDMLARTLHAPSGGGLHVADIRGSDGELGLKASGSDDYFGLIYIGDTAKFKKLVRNDNAGITVEDDAMSGSLFEEIGNAGTTIETLIGSRKFIEGWSSWRVSNMGLLNIGRNEGSQIIQLFGRGVRLRGRNMTLKRSSALDGHHPEQIGLLETLNIFAVRANYMAQFRDYLEREGVPTRRLLELPLFIRPNTEFLNQGLVIPRMDEGLDFGADSEVVLEYVEGMRPVFIDMSAKVDSLDSDDLGIDDASARSGEETVISRESLALVDWDSIYFSLIEHKERKGMGNLVVRPDTLKSIMETEPQVYRLLAEHSLTSPTSAEEWERLQTTVTTILRLYADRLYRRSRKQWESDHMVYKTLDENDDNFRFNVGEGNRGRYVVGVQRSDESLIQEIEDLIANSSVLDESACPSLPSIHFDRHLYQPLLVEKNGLKMWPPGLTDSEQKFVKDLKEYWKKNRQDGPDDTDVFLLRNQGRGSGVGFFNASGFYPDFILWIKTGESQRIVFVEPHGMVHENAPEHSDKIRLYQRLHRLSEDIGKRSGLDNVTLDSYIVSATPYDMLCKRWRGNWSRSDFAKEHVLFPERSCEYDYLAEMMIGEKPVTAPSACPDGSLRSIS